MTSLVFKHLRAILLAVAGALLLLYSLALFSHNIYPISFLRTEYLRNALNALRRFFFSTPWVPWLLIGLFVFIVLFMALSMPTILRIKRISGAVREIARGDLSARLHPRGNDELSQLESDVNLMARRIERAFEDQRAAERSKDEFIMNIAHDLRTPLTSVLGYLSLIDEKGLEDGDCAQYARIALSKANQLSTLVGDLFDLLRMTPEAMKLEPVAFSARQFLLQVQDEAYPLLSAAGMELRLADVPEGLMILADGALLSRVYDNLILNAVRYAGDGKYIDLAAREDGTDTLLSVTTHANPVPEEELELVFERLHRVEASRSSETGGAGLGLAICRGIVELHGGWIRAVGAGGGTRFEIWLPTYGSPE